MEKVCKYCGVVHAGPQSFCDGCGGALPAAAAPKAPKPPQPRKIIGAAIGLAVLVVAVLVVSNWLSGPQQVEIVAMPGQKYPMEVPTDTAAAAEQHRYLQTANLKAAHSIVIPLRLMLNEHRMFTGEYPADFATMRMDPDDLSDGEFVTAVTLEPGGVLVAHLDATKFGKKEFLRLAPRDVMGGTRTRWDCTTSIPDDARISIPGDTQCPFDAGLAR